MNSLAFFRRLIQVTGLKNMDTVGAAESMDLVDALNSALAEFYGEAPDRYRRREVYLPVRAPVVFRGTFTKGSREIEGINDPGVNPAVIIKGAGKPLANTVYIEQSDGTFRPSEAIDYPRIRQSGGNGDTSLELDLASNDLGVYTNPNSKPWEGVWTAQAGSEPAPTALLLSERLPLDWYGSSVAIDGEEHWNRIDGATTLAKAYEGPSGEKNFTVYGDVVPVDGWSVERLYLDPVMADGHPLVRDSGMAQYGSSYWRQTAPHGIGFYPGASDKKRIGRPYYYDIRPAGSIQKGRVADFSLVVLDPAPSTANALRMGIVHNAPQFSLSSVQEVITIPLPDNICATILLPLAKDSLLASGSVTVDPSLIIREAEKARRKIAKLPAYSAPPHHSIGTRLGY